MLTVYAVLQKQGTERYEAAFKVFILKTCAHIWVCSTFKAHILSQAGCQCQAWKRRKHLQATSSKRQHSKQHRTIPGDQMLNSLISVGPWHNRIFKLPPNNSQAQKLGLSAATLQCLAVTRSVYVSELSIFSFKELGVQPLKSFKNWAFQR